MNVTELHLGKNKENRRKQKDGTVISWEWRDETTLALNVGR